jgi:signal transduction histidine kinase
VIGSDEISALSVAFNHMASRLDELHDLEAQLRRRNQLHTMGDVAMGLAHEIRNPLSIIKTATELLRRRMSVMNEDISYLDYVISETGRINELITEFLDFASPRPYQRMCQPLRPLIDELVSFCEPEFRVGHIAVAIDDQAPGIAIYADGQQLREACLNLILNAIDAMPNGGRLTIGISVAQVGVKLTFTDTGIGISADVIDHIFTPFMTTKAHGTGLGLAKVFSVVDSHEGTIECTSVPGAGTTFTLVLPSGPKD